MTTRTQPDLPFVDPLEPRVLPRDGEAWFTLNHFVPSIGVDGEEASRRMVQRPYQLSDYEGIVRACGVRAPSIRLIDHYLSQGFFALPCRRAVHLVWLTHAYCDLDIYGKAPDDLVRELIWHCADHDIPPPSAILTSGRGFYCKWFWSQPIPRVEVGRAVAINRALVRLLAPFRPDPRAVDGSRILRLVGTVNSKNGGAVAIVWLNGPPGAPTTYDFDAFARAILSAAVDNCPDGVLHGGIAQARRDTPRHLHVTLFNREHWHWGVLEDIRALAAARYPGGIVQEGMRDLYGHLAACQLARVIPPATLFHEIVATVRSFLPAGYIDRELRGHCSTLLRRAVQAAEGERVRFRGKERTPIYTYSKACMIDRLGITPDEERNMTRLISDAEKRRRENERRAAQRRAADMLERAEYEAGAAERRATARMLRNQGLPWAEVAERMGLPSAGAARVLAIRA
jgi:hypothetical protein